VKRPAGTLHRFTQEPHDVCNQKGHIKKYKLYFLSPAVENKLEAPAAPEPTAHGLSSRP
jgi:hypothetical protein